MNKNQQAFFELVRAGLWEKEARLLPYGEVDYEEVMRLAEEQSVVGLVAAGLEHVTDVKIPKENVLQFVGQALQLEQCNSAMNHFIGILVERMRNEGIYTLILKGQGIAQCYEKPLWRACGDIDFLLNDENYKKAKAFMIPIADSVEKESGKHQGLTIGAWVVELHANQHCGLSVRMDKAIDDVQKDCLCGGKVRSWTNGKTEVFLPGPDNDIIFVFTHYLKHFYKGGLGMRQICDWCRLLRTYRSEIDLGLLEKRLKEMGLVTEWKAFGAYVVDYLGMPVEAMPLYENIDKWKKKANRISTFIMSVGNMGHNRDMNPIGRNFFVVRKMVSFYQRVADFFNHALIFPLDSLRFFPTIVFNGIRLAARGIG